MRTTSLSLAPTDDQPQFSARIAFGFSALGLILTVVAAAFFDQAMHMDSIPAMGFYGGQLALGILLTLFFFTSGVARVFRKRAAVPFDQLTRAEQRLLNGIWPSTKPRPEA